MYVDVTITCKVLLLPFVRVEETKEKCVVLLCFAMPCCAVTCRGCVSVHGGLKELFEGVGAVQGKRPVDEWTRRGLVKALDLVERGVLSCRVLSFLC